MAALHLTFLPSRGDSIRHLDPSTAYECFNAPLEFLVSPPTCRLVLAASCCVQVEQLRTVTKGGRLPLLVDSSTQADSAERATLLMSKTITPAPTGSLEGREGREAGLRAYTPELR